MKECTTCYGYGFWAWGDRVPMGSMDASDGFDTLECPECKANPNPVSDRVRKASGTEYTEYKETPAGTSPIADYINKIGELQKEWNSMKEEIISVQLTQEEEKKLSELAEYIHGTKGQVIRILIQSIMSGDIEVVSHTQARKK